jgi:hypothetical protein
MKPLPQPGVNSVRRKFLNPLIKSMNAGRRQPGLKVEVETKKTGVKSPRF